MKRILNTFKDERGQSVALLILVASAMMGFVALGIDGGMAYMIRRQAQNAADSGAMAGSYMVLNQQRGEGFNQQAVRARVNQVVQAHGVPDTDGDPNNHVNANVEVVYTDENGQVLGNGCEMAVNCSSAIVTEGWGVRVRVRRSFNTFFAGMIGWQMLTVRANAVSVARSLGGQSLDYAIFATDARQCRNESADMHAGWGRIIGNVHSNARVNHAGGDQRVEGTITHISGCNQCVATQGIRTVERFAPRIPDYNAYRTLAMTQAQGSNGTYFNRNVTNNNIGSAQRPFTHITGNLTLQSSTFTLRGLIYVQGSVDINGATLTSTSNFTIISDSNIMFNGNNVSLANGPYRNPNYPLLRNNVVTLYSNHSPDSPSQCGGSAETIKFAGAGHYIVGAILAPRGVIHLSGSTITVYGSLVGSTVKVTGAEHYIANAGYFPPQNDRIELLQ
jgi:hypothetical protein